MNRVSRSRLASFVGPLFAVAAFCAGCGGRPFVPATPQGFVDLEDIYGDTEYRAATPDGVVIGIRAFENKPKGETAFWTKALENRMRDVGGYALLDKRAVKNRGGLTGTELRFGHDEGKTPHVYILAVFSTAEHVYLIEAGGTKDEMKRQEEQIDWAILNFLQKE